ncbi:MAG TPA: hypothetical protein VIU12_16245 [Chryseolinea sp.]
MTGDQTFAIVLSSLTIIGTLIGTFFSPLITHRLESLRDKRKLKPNLLKTIYLFYMYRKNAFNCLDFSYSSSEAHKYYREDLQKTSITPSEKEEIEKKLKITDDESDENSKKIESITEKQNEIESTIFSLLAEMEFHYSNKIFMKLYKLITVEIEKSNDPTLHRKYEIYPRSQFFDLNRRRKEYILKKFVEMDNERTTLTRALLKLI